MTRIALGDQERPLIVGAVVVRTFPVANRSNSPSQWKEPAFDRRDWLVPRAGSQGRCAQCWFRRHTRHRNRLVIVSSDPSMSLTRAGPCRHALRMKVIRSQTARSRPVSSPRQTSTVAQARIEKRSDRALPATGRRSPVGFASAGLGNGWHRQLRDRGFIHRSDEECVERQFFPDNRPSSLGRRCPGVESVPCFANGTAPSSVGQGSERLSINKHSTPCCPKSIASVSPTGPPPMIKTGWSCMAVISSYAPFECSSEATSPLPGTGFAIRTLCRVFAKPTSNIEVNKSKFVLRSGRSTS